MTIRYLEDFAVGQAFRSGPRRIDAEQITAFAAACDPQPFHLNEAAARDTRFHGLVASGWHTGPQSPCGSWWRAISALRAASWVPASRRAAGRGPCGPGIRSASHATRWRCDRHSRVQARGS
jgi:acyl dehydratase